MVPHIFLDTYSCTVSIKTTSPKCYKECRSSARGRPVADRWSVKYYSFNLLRTLSEKVTVPWTSTESCSSASVLIHHTLYFGKCLTWYNDDITNTVFFIRKSWVVFVCSYFFTVKNLVLKSLSTPFNNKWNFTNDEDLTSNMKQKVVIFICPHVKKYC